MVEREEQRGPVADPKDDIPEELRRFVWGDDEVEIVERADQEERTKPVSPPK